MEIYIIIAFSFAIMYTYVYGLETVRTVIDTANLFDMTYEEDSDWCPNSYILAVFVGSLIAMPIFLITILVQNKYEIIKRHSSAILKKYFGLMEQE